MTDPKAIAAKLTEAQRRALQADHSRGESAYSMRVGINTLEALHRRGLVGRRGGVGSMFSPSTSIDWPLTPLGLAVRRELENQP